MRSISDAGANKFGDMNFYCRVGIIQGEHKFFPWLQTFITRKLCGIQTGARVEVY